MGSESVTFAAKLNPEQRERFYSLKQEHGLTCTASNGFTLPFV